MRRIPLALIVAMAGTATLLAESPPGQTEIRAAIIKGLRRIEQGSMNYTANRACFSCHHQMALPVFAAAKRRGLAVPDADMFIQTEFTRETFRPKLDLINKGQGIPGANTMAAYALFVLESAGQQPDDTTAGLIHFLTQRQAADGSWPALADRPPSEGSPFTNAALALRALKVYGLGDESLPPDLLAKVQKSIERGRDWLIDSRPKTTEDKAFHLQALVEAEVDKKQIAVAGEALVGAQRSDGGWAQLDKLDSDAYATGVVLSALSRAGYSPGKKPIQRGLSYLIQTQKADGSWFVQTRSRPVQLFFDNGDPGGKSQFISFLATNWALLALLDACDQK